MFTREWLSSQQNGNTPADKTKLYSQLQMIGKWSKQKIGTATSVSLFVLASCFAWQTPFEFTGAHDELQNSLFDSSGGGVLESLSILDAGKLLHHCGMSMLALFAMRKCSGKKLRSLWDRMASFNHQEKIDEVKFITMEFLLIGYIMLVSAATQPLACHTDLDAKIKMSADNSSAI